MLTELKSRDYVSRVYCTPETQGAEIFPLSRPGGSGESDLGWADDAVAPLPGRRDNRCKISDRRDYRTGVDVAALIKRARLQIDRHPAWLRESGPLQRKQTCPNEATFRLQTFIGGLAHHFNNLFMVIQGNLSLMRMPGPGAKRHQPRFKRMEKLIQCESMLTNDLLGPTVDPRYRCNLALQTRVLGEVVLIAEQIHPTGQNLCVFPIPLDFDFMATFLPRLAGSVAAILESIIAELKHHCSVITADWPGPGSDLQRLQPIVAALRRGALWSAKLSEYSGTHCNLDGGTAQRKMVEIAFDRWTRSHRRVPLNLSCTKTVPLPGPWTASLKNSTRMPNFIAPPIQRYRCTSAERGRVWPLRSPTRGRASRRTFATGSACRFFQTEPPRATAAWDWPVSPASCAPSGGKFLFSRQPVPGQP